MTDKPSETGTKRKQVTKLEVNDWQVLIVDDRKDNLLIAQEALQFHGATVKTAINGIEGLEALEDFPATLILMDLSMPDMDGWEMFKRVRNNSATAHIPVIALTAHVMAGDEQKVMQAGFEGYIAKPFSVATIVLQIQSILRKLANEDEA